MIMTTVARTAWNRCYGVNVLWVLILQIKSAGQCRIYWPKYLGNFVSNIFVFLPEILVRSTLKSQKILTTAIPDAVKQLQVYSLLMENIQKKKISTTKEMRPADDPSRKCSWILTGTQKKMCKWVPPNPNMDHLNSRLIRKILGAFFS